MTQRIDSRKMIKNTWLLYTRQIIILVVNLVSVRILLHGLGEEDYGLYTLVAGIATMFSVLSGAMSSACQRFYSFYMGQKKKEELQTCVLVSVIVYLLIAVIVIGVTETAGLWYVCNRLTIPAARYEQVILLYHFSIVSLVLTIFTSPFIAYVLSSEDMGIYACISIVEVVLKLLIAFTIGYITANKRLAVYGALLIVVSLISLLSYFTVTKIKYNWKAAGKFDYVMFRQMLSFASWSLFGSSIFAFKNQAVNIIINQVFNPIVVTARGVATSVYSALVSFSTNFTNALKPQIVKSYAAGESEDLYDIIYFTSKITFLLMFLIMFPFWYDMPFVINLWLGKIPEYVVGFARLGLIEALVESVTLPISPLIDATGKIKKYQLVVGGILLLNFPLCLILLDRISNPNIAYYIAIGLTCVASFARIICASKVTHLSVWGYVKEVLIKIIAMVVIIFGVVAIFYNTIPHGIVRHCITYLFFGLAFLILSWLLVFNVEERKWIKERLNDKIDKRI